MADIYTQHAAAFAAAATLDGGQDWTRAVENAGFTVLQAV